LESDVRIVAKVVNSFNAHAVEVVTDGVTHAISIPPKPSGFGSSLNGGELLFLALATCYCNDLYREAAGRSITITAVEVEVSGDFGGRGEPAHRIVYRVTVQSDAPDEDISALLVETDRVAEIHNTIRQGCPITFER
jgi:organic hydroperoxide reductase OsmC/OhrA